MGVLGTIAVERLFDGCVLVLMLLISGAIVGFDDRRLQAIADRLERRLPRGADRLLRPHAFRRARAQGHPLRPAGSCPSGSSTWSKESPTRSSLSLRSVHSAKTLASAVFALSAVAWTDRGGLLRGHRAGLRPWRRLRELLPAARGGEPRDHHPDLLRRHRAVRMGGEADARGRRRRGLAGQRLLGHRARSHPHPDDDPRPDLPLELRHLVPAADGSARRPWRRRPLP